MNTGTCSDTGGSGCSAATVTRLYNTNTNTTTASPGTVTDVVGHSVVCPGNQIVRVDVTPPTCVSSGGSTTWATSRTITGTCSDTGGSGCSAATISRLYNTNTNTTTASPGSISDAAGNSVTCPGNQTVRVDVTPPTCASSGGSATWATSRTITGTCSDTGGSGCSTATVTRLYNTNTNTTTASPGSLSDAAGNSVTCPGNQTVRVDVTSPTCAVSGGNAAWTNGNRTITGTCSDTGGSGCLSNLSYTYTTDINTTTAGSQGNNVGGTVYDNAGNSVACTANQTVRIDKTAPTCTVAKTNVGTVDGVTITISRTDSGGSSVTVPAAYTGVKSTATYSLTDAVGNNGICTGDAAVTKVTEYRSNTCSTFTSCSNSVCGNATCPNIECGCQTWGNYTSTLAVNNTCSEPGNPGTDQVYVRNERWAEWKCYCKSNPQPACTWIVVAQSCWYNPSDCENSCGTACAESNNPGWAGCGDWYGNDDWVDNGDICEQRTYTGTCSTFKTCTTAGCGYASCQTSACGCAIWGGWSSWTTTSCSSITNEKQCETRDVYN